ncbi:MAG: ATP-grasp domain-containing protein [Chlamydiia bacterium]|nr:ATP-grasp domain-containing protein [Chlamydiia bacterium]
MSTSQRILLTGARAPVTLDLARMLQANGHKVFVADTTQAHVCRFSNAVKRSFVVPAPIEGTLSFVIALKDIVCAEQIDCLIPTCEEVFAIAQHMDVLTKHCRVFCEAIDRLEPLHNKATFIELLQSFGLPFPQTLKLTSPADVEAALERWERVVFKPVYSRFARDVLICHRSDTERVRCVLPSASDPWVAQQYIEGERLCTYTVAEEGRVLAHTSYPVEHCLGRIGSALAYRNVHHRAALALVAELVNKLDYTGQLSLDLIVGPDGVPVPIECNPRATSGLHLFRAEDRLDQAFLGGIPAKTPPEGRHAHVALPLLLMGGKHRFKAWTQGRDVIFSSRDPLPALISPLLLLYFAIKGLKLGMSMTQASTYDIEWNGHDICASV